MTETTVNLSVGIHNTPLEIWDALARVCDVQAHDMSAWITFSTPSGADIKFFRPRSLAAAETPAEVVA